LYRARKQFPNQMEVWCSTAWGAWLGPFADDRRATRPANFCTSKNPPQASAPVPDRYVLIAESGFFTNRKRPPTRFAMDGQRPMDELSEARNLGKVLGFRDSREGDREFAVDEMMHRTGTTLTTVIRSPRDDDVRIGPLPPPVSRFILTHS
jgi:hypothetical protein